MASVSFGRRTSSGGPRGRRARCPPSPVSAGRRARGPLRSFPAATRLSVFGVYVFVLFCLFVYVYSIYERNVILAIS